MALDSITVTADDIRTELDEIDADRLEESTIQRRIEDAEIEVEAALPSDWQTDTHEEITTERVEMLVRRIAARDAFHSSPMKVREQALDAVVSWDIQSFRGRLNDRVSKAWELIGLPRADGPSPFATATRHLGGDG